MNNKFGLLLFLSLLACCGIKLHAQQVAVQATALNVLYAGLPNPLRISVAGYPVDKIVVRGENMKISGEKGEYTAIVELSNDRIALVHVGVLKKKDTLWCDTLKYRIKVIPTPELRLGSLASGSYSRAQVLAQQTVLAFMEGFIFEGIYFTVTEYSFTYISRYTIYQQEHIKGNSISHSINWYRLLPGDKIIIWNVTANGSYMLHSMPKKLAPIEITIKGVHELKPEDSVYTCMNIPEAMTRIETADTAGKKHFYRYLTACPRQEQMLAHSISDSGLVTFCETWYSNGKRHFTMDNLVDSVMGYSSWYPNGNKKHVGYLLIPEKTQNMDFDIELSQPRLKILSNGDTAESGDPLLFADPEMNPLYPLGYWEEYHPNGKLHFTGQYSSLMQESVVKYPDYYTQILRMGTWKFYDTTGRLTFEIEYDQEGKEVRRTKH